MKFIKVTVSAWIEVPDEIEITRKDGDSCVQINGEYFMPYCEWMKWQEHTWISAGDEWEKYDDLHAEEIKIEQLSDPGGLAVPQGPPRPDTTLRAYPTTCVTLDLFSDS